MTTVNDYIDFGSGASIDTPAIATVCSWVKISDTTVGNRFVGVKFDPGGVNGFYAMSVGQVTTAGNLFTEVGRATQSMKCASSSSPMVNNVWSFCVYQWNIGGVLADQKLFHGNQFTPVTEVSSYDAGNYRLGSGAQLSDAGGSLLCGEFVPASGFANPVQNVAFLGMWTRTLTLAELRDQQRAPRMTRGCVLFTFPGLNRTGFLRDYSGRSNPGAITGSPVYRQGPNILLPAQAA